MDLYENGFYKFINYILSGDLEKVKKNFKAEFLQSTDLNGSSPFVMACQYGLMRIAEFLIQYIKSPDQITNNGKTPIYIACQYDHKDIVDLLIKNNFNIELPTKTHGETPIIIACQYGHKSIVELLINNNCNKEIFNNYGYSLIHVACSFGQVEAVELLIKYKCNIEIKTKIFNETAIIVACRFGYIGIVELLIKCNCNVEATNNHGETPFHIACTYNHIDIVELLITHNSNIEAVNKYGDVAIIVACRFGHIEIVELLIKHNCNIEATNNNGETAIIVACRNGHVEIVELLIKHNCNTEATNNQGKSLLDFIKENENKSFYDFVKNEIEQRQINRIKMERIALVMREECCEGCDHSFCFETLNSKEFRDKNKIADGAFGLVYKLSDFQTNLQLAVKVVKLNNMNENSKENFEKDIDKYRNKILHKKILQYFGTQIKRKKLFIFMEYIEQGTLANKLKNSVVLKISDIIIYSKDILEALDFLHSKRIIHRDLKPQNILMDKDNHIKLCDFGLSVNLETVAETTVKQSKVSSFCGTYFYMAPEIVKNEKYSYPVDIWAFGVTFVEMLTGKRPNSDITHEAAIIFKIGSNDPLDYKLPQDSSKAVESFLKDIFNPSPIERPTAKALLTYINDNDMEA